MDLLRVSACDEHFVKYWDANLCFQPTLFTRLRVAVLFKFIVFFMWHLFEGGTFHRLYNRPTHNRSSGDRVK